MRGPYDSSGIIRFINQPEALENQLCVFTHSVVSLWTVGVRCCCFEAGPHGMLKPNACDTTDKWLQLTAMGKSLKTSQASEG